MAHAKAGAAALCAHSTEYETHVDGRVARCWHRAVEQSKCYPVAILSSTDASQDDFLLAVERWPIGRGEAHIHRKICWKRISQFVDSDITQFTISEFYEVVRPNVWQGRVPQHKKVSVTDPTMHNRDQLLFLSSVQELLCDVKCLIVLSVLNRHPWHSANKPGMGGVRSTFQDRATGGGPSPNLH